MTTLTKALTDMTNEVERNRNDPLGDRMKAFEQVEAGRRLMPLLPALARIDGRSFSRFTRGLDRPFDERLTTAMIATTMRLVQETGALLGYTQSDEISLAWVQPSFDSEIFFAGKIQKMVSQLAALATVHFNEVIRDLLPGYNLKRPTFDCRVWNVPNLAEATNVFLWREIDATKNSVSMATRHHYSHQECHLKTVGDMHEMLFRKGINWNDYPDPFKRGQYIVKRTVTNRISEDELSRLPPKHEARRNPDLEFTRSVIERVSMPPLARVVNRTDVLFRGADPIMATDTRASLEPGRTEPTVT